MKRLILICALLIVSVTVSLAQPGQNQNKNQNRDFQLLQMNLIIKRLDITDQATEDKFKVLYTEYSTKVRELRPKHNKRGGEKPSEQEIEQQIIDSFDVAEKTTALKREYYVLFREILNPHQILRMYNVERQISDKINSEIQNRNSDEQKGRQERQISYHPKSK